MKKRPPGLVAIIYYKAFTAALFTLTAVSIFLTLKKYEQIRQLADSLELAGKQGIITWIVEKILDVNPKTLEFGWVVAAIYAVITLIEAVGLWYEQAWARWLVLCVVGISILPETVELIRSFSVLKLFVLSLNICIFVYLLRDFPSKRRRG